MSAWGREKRLNLYLEELLKKKKKIDFKNILCSSSCLMISLKKTRWSSVLVSSLPCVSCGSDLELGSKSKAKGGKWNKRLHLFCTLKTVFKRWSSCWFCLKHYHPFLPFVSYYFSNLVKDFKSNETNAWGREKDWWWFEENWFVRAFEFQI